MDDIKTTIMRRDNLTSAQAEKLINEAKDDLNERMTDFDFDPDEFMSDWFGLEPDYFIELLD